MNGLSDLHLLWIVCWLSHIAVEGGKLVSPNPCLQKVCLRALLCAQLHSPFTLMSLQKLQAGPWIHLYADDTISYSLGPSLSAASTPQLSLTSVEHFFCNLHFASMPTKWPRPQLKNLTHIRRTSLSSYSFYFAPADDWNSLQHTLELTTLTASTNMHTAHACPWTRVSFSLCLLRLFV